MPGVYGQAAPVAMQPGDRALMVGYRNIPGFFGNVNPGGGSSSSQDSSGDYPQTLAQNQKAGPVVIAAMGGRHPATQRQITWRIYPTKAGVNLQAATQDSEASYVTIDSSVGDATGDGNIETRTIPADDDIANGLLSANNNVSACRFFRVLNTNSSGFTGFVDITCL